MSGTDIQQHITWWILCWHRCNVIRHGTWGGVGGCLNVHVDSKQKRMCLWKRCFMLRQFVCVDRVKMLHVTSICLCWPSEDVTCYIMGYGWSQDRCYMYLHVTLSCLCWPSKDGLAEAKGQTRCWCNMRSSGNGGGSRRNTCFRLLVDSCTKKPLDENAPRNKHWWAKHAYIKTKWPKTQVLDTWRKEFDQIPCRH